MRMKRALTTKNQEVSMQQTTEEMYHNSVGDNRSKGECAFLVPTDPQGQKAMKFWKLIGPLAEISVLSYS